MSFFKEKTEKSTDKNNKKLELAAGEQYRVLRTNILNKMMSSELKCPVIGVTSSVKGEGCTTTAVNLAYVFSEKGCRVLLVDANLRTPAVARTLGTTNDTGLVNLINDISEETLSLNVRESVNENMYVLTSGPVPANPSELVSSAQMENMLDALKEYFDYIILDLPPVSLYTDAISMSSYIDGMIVVVRENYVKTADVDECFRQLELAKVNILGYVMNNSDGAKAKYKKQL